jgi:hypothetical protein
LCVVLLIFAAPVFVVQHLFDEAQITVNNVGPPVKKSQWQYIHRIGQDMKTTLSNVSWVFTQIEAKY